MAEWDFGNIPDANAKQRDITSNVKIAQQENPAEFGNALRVSNQLGVPTGVAAADPAGLEEVAQWDFGGIPDRYPLTADWMSNYENAVVSKSDVSVLSQIEAVVRGPFAGFTEAAGLAFAGAGRGAQAAIRLSAHGVDALLPESMDRFIWSQPDDAAAFDPIWATLQQSRATGEWLQELSTQMAGPVEAQTFASDVSKGLGQLMGQAVQAVFAPQTLTPSLFAMGVEMQGQQQDESGTAGTSAMADLGLLGGGAVTMASERIGLDELLNRIPPQIKGRIQQTLVDMVIGGGIEAAQEAVENVTHNLVTMTTTDGSQPLLEGTVEEASVAGVVGFLARGLLRAALPGRELGTLQNQDNEAKAQFMQDQVTLDRLRDLAVQSDTLKNSQAKFHEFIQQSDGDRNTTIFIDRAKVAEYVNQNYRPDDESMVVLSNALDEASASDTPVALGVADFTTYLAPSKHYNALRDSMTLNPQVSTPEQYATERAEFQKYVQEVMQTANENVSLYVEAQDAYESVRQQLVDTGVVSPRNAGIMAQVVPAWAVSYAKRHGVSVQQAMGTLTIEGPMTGRAAAVEGALMQSFDFRVVAAGDKVSGFTVREEIPNMGSIGASLDDYTVLEGVREVPMTAFDSEYVSSVTPKNLDKRTRLLAAEIDESKELNPLIVVMDSKGAYILEGGHRFDSLISLGVDSIPALVVIDKSDPPVQFEQTGRAAAVESELSFLQRGFHGTSARFETFTPSERGTFGPGIYFTGESNQAKTYGNRVVQAEVNLNNPWVVEADYDSEAAQTEDFDSPSIDAVLSLPNGRELLESAKASDGMYGAELQSTLVELGYDGIIATYPDGSQEIVAFAADQITDISEAFNQEARGYYQPANTLIRLTEASDLSTFLHEFAHFMFEMERQGGGEMLQSMNNWFKRNAAEVAKEANGYLGREGELTQGYDHLAAEKFLRPFQPALDAAKRVAERLGLKYTPPREFAALDRQRATRIAREYELMKHDPQNPEVKAAYEALAKETVVQYEELLKTGIKLEFIKGKDPYAKSPRMAIQDVIENNHLWVFSTRDGFGSDQAFDPSDNPLLAETEFEISGEKALVNDLFRVVHDYFGHIKGGVGFRAEGEENAWQAHAAMFSPLARRALTTETRGQNSWVNFGPHGEYNRTASAGKTKYADQKTGLMPLWVSEEGHVNAERRADTTGRNASGRLVEPPVKNGRITLTHFSNTDGLRRLDPAFYGTNYAGAEKARRSDKNWVDRTYYGIAVGEPGGYKREKGVGAKRYTSSIDANLLYDIQEDPLNLRKKLRGPSGPARLNRYEKLIRDAGFSGYWINDEGMGMVAAVFDPLQTEAEFTGDGKQVFGQDDIPAVSEGPITEADVSAYLDNGTTGDSAKDAAINRAVHEQLARGFEQYLMEGVAPSVELRGFFRSIARWINQVYQNLKRFMRVNLDDDMRQVFDRLLATDEQIAAANVRGRAKPMFRTAEDAGMTEQQFSDYLQQQDKAQASASETLRNKMIEEITRTKKQWWKNEKAALVQEETERLNDEQAYRAIDTLKNTDFKLDRVDVKDRVGRQQTSRTGVTATVVPSQLSGMTVAGAKGLPVDDAAAFLGYDSGDELLYVLMNTQPIKQAAEEAAEQRMLETHGDILNDGTIQELADEAVQNEERGRVMLTEFRTLAKGTRAPKIDLATVKASAQEHIAQLAYKDIHPEKYRAAEIRFAREAESAMTEGDKTQAAFLKSQQLLNHYYAIEATKAREQVNDVVQFMARYNKAKVREEILRAGNGYWEQIEKILARFEFRRSATLASTNAANVDSIQKWAEQRMDEDGDNLVLSAEVMNELVKTHWKNVPLDQLLGVRDSVKNIEHVAKYGNKIRKGEEEVSHQKLVSQWAEHVNSVVKSQFKTTGMTAVEKSSFMFDVMAQQTKVPFLTSWLDGGERVGITHDILMTPMNEALHQKNLLWDRVGKSVVNALASRSKEDLARHNTKLFIPELQGTSFGPNMMGHQVLAIALNTGNPSNLRKLLLGEGWASPDNEVEITIDNPRLQAVLRHMTRSDWELVQTIWNEVNVLYPMLADVHRRTSGVTPPKVEAQSFTVRTADGSDITIDGGYYPVKYDANRSARAALHEERKAANVDSMFSTTGSIQASVNASATSERTGYYAPIRADLGVVVNHIEETIHYITHHDAVRSVNKFLRDPLVRQTVVEKMGQAEYDQLKTWLNAVAKDGRESPNKSFIDSVNARLRFGMTLGMMGFKASTGLMQLAGLTTTAAEVGSANVARALKSIFFSEQSMQESWQYAVTNSKVLKHRDRTMDRELRSAVERLEGKRGFMHAVQEASMKHIMLIQTYGVDLPTWYAAYHKEMRDSGDEGKAIKYADWAVENLQGSGATKDMAGILRNQTGTHRLFTMFMTYFSTLWNLERDTVRGARSGRYSVTTVAAKAAFLLVLPVIYEAWMRGELEAPDDDDDDDRMAKITAAVALYPFQSVPFVRDVANGVLSGYGFRITPVQSVLEGAIRGVRGLGEVAITDKQLQDMTKGEVEGLVKGVGVGLGVPGVNQAWSTLESMYQVLEEGEDATVRELLFGPKTE